MFCGRTDLLVTWTQESRFLPQSFSEDLLYTRGASAPVCAKAAEMPQKNCSGTTKDYIAGPVVLGV